MSSAPTPISAGVAPTPMYSPAPTYFGAQPVDYGPAGTIPTLPGTSYFAEKTGTKFFAIVLLILGVLVTLFGLLGVLGGGGAGGIGIVSFGLIMGVGGYFLRKHQVHSDIVCDAQGITVRNTSKKTGVAPPIFVPWQAVTAMRCSVTRNTRSGDVGNDINTDTQNFHIDTAAGSPVFASEGKLKNFAGFIELCNASTPQLGYKWLKRRKAHGLTSLASVGTYVAVSK